MTNNIFNYATSELSQDAFLCWCANWFNDSSNQKLREMSIELLKHFAKVNDIKSVRIERQFSRKITITEENGKENEEKPISVKIDVLLIVNNSVAVIIEDKTATSEHDEQIQRYSRGVKQIIECSKKGEPFYGVQSIRSVFLKTGFIFDEDRCVKADLVVTSEDLLKILGKYVGNSEILDSYVEKLENDLQFNEALKHYVASDESFWDWKIVKYSIAQYWLMRDIFPETLWTDRDNWIYRVYNGTSYGRPWTQMHILEENHKNSEDFFSVFWRIDTDSNGPYLSLRSYEDKELHKENAAQMDRHRTLYDAMSATMKNIVVEKDFFTWEDVKPSKYKGNCREAEIIHINLCDMLKSGEDTRQEWMNAVRQMTDEFVTKAKEII